ncbi:MAG: restriction endonuclease subunit S [Chthonomonadales bacterium]|nr:restriction endonuclease subunit S [Chthonomonadales bacterium]
MAGEWRASTWGDEISLEYGKALRGHETAVGRCRVYGSNGPIGWTDESLAQGPGVILGRKGAYRGVRFSREPFFVIDTAYFVVPKSELDMRWLYYAIKHNKLGEVDDGSPIPSTTRAAVYMLDLDVPPLDEQRAIAHILGTLDDKIELNRRMSETLEAMARALFQSWFIDFDPVRAKLALSEAEGAAGRDPGLPQPLADLFPARLVDSELGEIPEGWEVQAVAEHTVNFDSKRVPVSGAERSKRQGTYPYHGAAGVMDYVDDYLFDGIHLLVGEDGSVVQNNGLAVTQYVWGKVWVNNHAHVLQGRGTVSTEQLYLYFHFEPVAPYVTGAVQPKLSQGRMNTMPFVFAGEALCRAFERTIQPWFARLRACVDESRTLASLRDALLPKLISGELRAKDAEQFIGRTV